MKRYTDSRISFSYPSDMLLKYCKRGIYSLVQQDEDLVISIHLLDSFIKKGFEATDILRQDCIPPQTRLEILGHVSFGDNQGIAQRRLELSSDGQIRGKIFELLLENNNICPVLVTLACLRKNDFDENDYVEIFKSIKVKCSVKDCV